MEEAQKEVDKYKDEVVDLLKEAILDLYREGKEVENTLITEYQTIIEERKNVLNNLGDIIFLDNEMVEESEISISLINKEQEALNEAESKIATYVFAQLLSQEDPDNQKLEVFLEKLESIDIKFIVEIETLKRENKTKQEIIDFLKEELRRSFSLILVDGLPEF
ncbi:hypothetical protein B4Q04_02150 [Zobellia sp. OII3]|uniref:hypothetical protein n=1 Tax=Zobellia sp. OII3 TaxID=2034520 RepID=UPI000B52A96F|nr:hypothetical protein [Zobellia sp. OII3]OWW26510.1 hypothetical protein B4Q04_02150 [Zobellia sp. OII3]